MASQIKQIADTLEALQKRFDGLRRLPQQIARVRDELGSLDTNQLVIADETDLQERADVRRALEAMAKIEATNLPALIAETANASDEFKASAGFYDLHRRLGDLATDLAVIEGQEQKQQLEFKFPSEISDDPIYGLDSLSYPQERAGFKEKRATFLRTFFSSFRDPFLKVQMALEKLYAVEFNSSPRTFMRDKDKAGRAFIKEFNRLSQEQRKQLIGHCLGILAYRMNHVMKEAAFWLDQDPQSDSFHATFKARIDDTLNSFRTRSSREVAAEELRDNSYEEQVSKFKGLYFRYALYLGVYNHLNETGAEAKQYIFNQQLKKQGQYDFFDLLLAREALLLEYGRGQYEELFRMRNFDALRQKLFMQGAEQRFIPSKLKELNEALGFKY